MFTLLSCSQEEICDKDIDESFRSTFAQLSGDVSFSGGTCWVAFFQTLR